MAGGGVGPDPPGHPDDAHQHDFPPFPQPLLEPGEVHSPPASDPLVQILASDGRHLVQMYLSTGVFVGLLVGGGVGGCGASVGFGVGGLVGLLVGGSVGATGALVGSGVGGLVGPETESVKQPPALVDTWFHILAFTLCGSKLLLPARLDLV